MTPSIYTAYLSPAPGYCTIAQASRTECFDVQRKNRNAYGEKCKEMNAWSIYRSAFLQILPNRVISKNPSKLPNLHLKNIWKCIITIQSIHRRDLKIIKKLEVCHHITWYRGITLSSQLVWIVKSVWLSITGYMCYV